MGALLGMGGDHGVKPFPRDFRRFLENFLGAGFEADVASFAPFLVNMNTRGLFYLFFNGQAIIPLHL
jgi:hypothetical protein